MLSRTKIDELLADENMGKAEKVKLNEYKAQCDNLIEIINTPVNYFSMRLFCFVWDALHWLSSHAVFIFNRIITKAYGIKSAFLQPSLRMQRRCF